jgi:hypothetical protein
MRFVALLKNAECRKMEIVTVLQGVTPQETAI